MKKMIQMVNDNHIVENIVVEVPDEETEAFINTEPPKSAEDRIAELEAMLSALLRGDTNAEP